MEILDYLFEKSKPPVDESDFAWETSWLKDYEAIQSMLLFDKWKGEPRARSVLTMGYDGTAWYARMVDHDNERSLTVTAKSLEEAVESLSRQLLDKATTWYNWKQNKSFKSKKKSAT